MQIESGETACPACGAQALQTFPVVHHMICAYVGPAYDFGVGTGGYSCPKCRRAIVTNDVTCEILGTSARCLRCCREMLVLPTN
jgi:hypothetical protein